MPLRAGDPQPGDDALVLAAVLWRAQPLLPTPGAHPYGTLLGSVSVAVRRNRPVPVTRAVSAIGFGVSTLFRMTITFVLNAEPYGYSVANIGPAGLVGMAGAVDPHRTGGLHVITRRGGG